MSTKMPTKAKDKPLTVRVPTAERRAFEAAVEAQDLTVSQVVRKLIRAYLANPQAYTDGTSQREQ